MLIGFLAFVAAKWFTYRDLSLHSQDDVNLMVSACWNSPHEPPLCHVEAAILGPRLPNLPLSRLKRRIISYLKDTAVKIVFSVIVF